MKTFDELRERVVSADKRPENYKTPGGKTKTRMVPVDKEIVKEEDYSPQKHEWGTDAAKKFAKKKTPGQEKMSEEKETKMDNKTITRHLQNYGYSKRNLEHLADRLTRIYKKPHVVRGDSIYVKENEIKTFKDIREKKMKGKDPCWDDHEMVGHKTMNGKKVPNCVPKEEFSQMQEISTKKLKAYSKKARKWNDKFNNDMLDNKKRPSKDWDKAEKRQSGEIAARTHLDNRGVRQGRASYERPEFDDTRDVSIFSRYGKKKKS
jgi:hypothetical protein